MNNLKIKFKKNSSHDVKKNETRTITFSRSRPGAVSVLKSTERPSQTHNPGQPDGLGEGRRSGDVSLAGFGTYRSSKRCGPLPKPDTQPGRTDGRAQAETLVRAL